ncbi:hypothetical protein CA85_03620 [Allorhodopirellula solitaria]|uniref:Uncharacterized protein n=2 Tax=Allorhodopirellula solitaria TaxID=2527987 RepID=A0A5C5YJK5_9BACT|nr:hypothetical protein CA85_03620 [Allorhodopirellula solitaria]
MLPKFVRSSAPLLTEIVLLVLMAWPAPIPVGHRHSDYSSRVSDTQLAWHLHCYHGGCAEAGDRSSDWHWHWVYPADHYANLEVGDVPQCVAPVVTGRLDAPLASPGISSLDCLTSKDWRTLDRPSLPPQRQLSFQSAAVLHCRQSLPELLGVIRC